MTAKRVIQKLHRWLGLLLGLQLVIWMMSGVVMSWFHITLVRGEVNSFAAAPTTLATTSYASPGGVVAQAPDAQTIELKTFLDKPVYIARWRGGAALFDAQTGDKLSPLPEDKAREIAKRDYVGEAEIAAVTLMDDPPHEYRRETPVWRADFDDKLQTRLYISPDTGEIVSRRNSIWRLYDFFWMLHIMDYDERENFNNPLIKTASATGLLFALSGMFLVLQRLFGGRYRDDVRQIGGAKNKRAGENRRA